MSKVSLYIYTKNTDLHAMSAFETVKSVLNYPYLNGLKRYRHITLTFTEWTDDEARQKVDDFNRHSFQLLNPNKEAALLHLQDALVGEISSSDLDAEGRLLKRLIEPAFDGHLTEVSVSIAWEFSVDAHGLSEDALKDELRHRIIDTTSYTQGLLINPIYEHFKWQTNAITAVS
jgi:hypothetical protein